MNSRVIIWFLNRNCFAFASIASSRFLQPHRKWQILAIPLITLPLAKASALTYVFNTTDDTVTASACKNGTGGCSLRGAIQEANAHFGDDTIMFNLPAGSLIFLNQALPDISEGVSISGPGADKLAVLKPLGSSDIYLVNVTASGTVSFSGLTLGGQAFGAKIGTAALPP